MRAVCGAFLMNAFRLRSIASTGDASPKYLRGPAVCRECASALPPLADRWVGGRRKDARRRQRSLCLRTRRRRAGGRTRVSRVLPRDTQRPSRRSALTGRKGGAHASSIFERKMSPIFWIRSARAREKQNSQAVLRRSSPNAFFPVSASTPMRAIILFSGPTALLQLVGGRDGLCEVLDNRLLLGTCMRARVCARACVRV